MDSYSYVGLAGGGWVGGWMGWRRRRLYLTMSVCLSSQADVGLPLVLGYDDVRRLGGWVGYRAGEAIWKS